MIRSFALILLCCAVASSTAHAQSSVPNDPFRGPNQAVQNLFERGGYTTQTPTNNIPYPQYGHNTSGANGYSQQGTAAQYYGRRGNSQFGVSNILIINGQPVAAVQTNRGVVFVPVGNNSNNYSTSHFRSRGSYRRTSTSKLGQGLYFGQ